MSPLQKGKLERDIESHLGKIEGEIEEYAISGSPNNLFLFYWHSNHIDVLLTYHYIQNDFLSTKHVEEYASRLENIEEKFNKLEVPKTKQIKEILFAQDTFNRHYQDGTNLIGTNNR